MVGAEARAVSIEAHVGSAKESFTVVGLPDTSVREAKDRVRAAIISTGREFPHRRVTVNLSPANLPKAGSDYDLPMALGVLAATGEASPATARIVAAGELSLDGSVTRTRSAIGAALLAAKRNWPCLVADRDASGAALVPGAVIYPVATLAEAVAVVAGSQPPARDHLLASASDRVNRRHGRRQGSTGGAACPGDRGRRRPSPLDGRVAGRRKDDARSAPAGDSASIVGGRSRRGRLRVVFGRSASTNLGATAVPFTPSLGLDGLGGRRRQRPSRSRRTFAGPSWSSLHG